MKDQTQTKCELDNDNLVALFRTAERAIESGEYNSRTWMIYQLCLKIVEMELVHDKVVEMFPEAEELLPSKLLSKSLKEHELEAMMALRKIDTELNEIMQEM